MNPTLPDEAQDLAASAAKAFEALGGVDAFRRAEEDPRVRSDLVAPALRSLGVDDLDPRIDEVALAAAAALCEAAGRVALPYPVASALVRDGDGRPTVAIPDGMARVDHGDLFDEWRVAPLAGDGWGGVAGAAGPRLGSRLGRFTCDLRFVGDDSSTNRSRGAADPDVLLQQVLVAWTVLGTVDRAVELAVEHVNGRVQFGKPIAAFQAVQFQVADAAVAVAGLRELAGFTLWQWGERRAAARADVLALRLHALEVARAVLRTCQQLHGAAGVCDEYDVSILTRAVQPALRLPFGAERAAAELAAAIAADGFDGLFPHGASLR